MYPACILVLGLAGIAAEPVRLTPETTGSENPTPPIRKSWLNRVDLTPLLDEARRRRPELTEEGLERLIQLNLEWVFFNYVRKGKFISPPDPGYIVDQMASVLQLNSRLEAVIEEGRRILSGEDSSEMIRVVTDAKGLCRKLRRIFQASFIEFPGQALRIYFPRIGKPDRQFLYFLLHAERLSSRITNRVEGIFLSRMPYVAGADQYQQHSIDVLTRSMEQLCKNAAEHLAHQ